MNFDVIRYKQQDVCIYLWHFCHCLLIALFNFCALRNIFMIAFTAVLCHSSVAHVLLRFVIFGLWKHWNEVPMYIFILFCKVYFHFVGQMTSFFLQLINICLLSLSRCSIRDTQRKNHLKLSFSHPTIITLYCTYSWEFFAADFLREITVFIKYVIENFMKHCNEWPECHLRG